MHKLVKQTFPSMNGIESLCFSHLEPHLCAVNGGGECTHSPPRKVPTKKIHQNTPKCPKVMTEQELILFKTIF